MAAVGLGGAVGTGARAILETWWPALPGAWPWTTFVINVAGAIALGLLLEALARRGPDAGGRRLLRLALGTGVLGGFTTYSALATEASLLAHGGAAGLALLYGGGSVLAGIAGAAVGIGLARLVVPRVPRGEGSG